MRERNLPVDFCVGSSMVHILVMMLIVGGLAGSIDAMDNGGFGVRDYMMLNSLNQNRGMGAQRVRIAELRQDLEAMRAERDGYVANGRPTASIDQAIENLEKALTEQAQGGMSIIGAAATRALAGPDAWQLLDLQAAKASTGIQAGLVYSALSVMRGRIQEMLENEGSEVWYSVVGGSLRSVSDAILHVWYKLFHGGYRPLSVKDVSDWAHCVEDIILFELDKNAEKSIKNHNTGRTDRMRTLQDADDLTGAPEAVDALLKEPEDRVWLLKVQGYSQDLSDFMQNLELCKPYYLVGAREGSAQVTIVRLMTRLQEDMRILRDEILLNSRSLKDLGAGDTRVFLSVLNKDIKNRFAHLSAILERYHGGASRPKTAGPSSSPSSSSGRNPYGYSNAGLAGL